MPSLEGLLPVILSAFAIYFFFKWVVKDMNRTPGDQ